MRRRGFLASAAAGLTVMFAAGCGQFPVIPKRPSPTAGDATGWVRHEAGAFVLFVPCAEMGQHIGHALRSMAALELGVPVSRIALRLPSTDEIPRVRATVGSDSVKDFALPLAQACATLREALAAGGTEPAAGVRTLVAQDWPVDRLRSFTFKAAAARQAGPIAFHHDIVTGAPLFAADMRLPGMVYGRVLRAPVSPALASTPVSWNEAAAREVPGFVAVVVDSRLLHGGSQGIGIVARTPGGLDRMAQKLAPRWQVDGGFTPQDIDARLDIDTHLQRGALRHSIKSDPVETGEPWTVDLRLDLPFAAHAGIEPRAALAAFAGAPGGGERLQVWTGTQDLFYVRDTLARRFSLDDDRVQVHACRIGGGFGARTLVLVELEAALLAQAVRAPVKVVWTRAQELAVGFHRPPSSHRLRARLKDGRITHWWHAFTSSHILFTPAAMPAWMQRAADFIGDQGVARGAALHYAVPHQCIEFDALRLPVHTGPWRGLGAGPNGLAVESAIDACARAARADPLAFRLAHTDDQRLQGVLRAAAASASESPRRRSGGNPAVRSGRGLACGVYKGASRVAVVADVEVERASGEVRVTALWCAHDCGRVVVPDGVRAQVEGCLVWCLGMVLVEGLPLGASGVSATGFAESPIPRIFQIPRLHVQLIESDAAPSGAGESAMMAGAAAIANAIFDATGVRCASFPVQPQALRAAA